MPDDDDGGDDDESSLMTMMMVNRTVVHKVASWWFFSCLIYDLCALDLFMWLCQELQPDLKDRHKQQSPVGKCFRLFEYHGCLSKGSIIIDIRQNRVDDYTMMIIWAKITRPGNIVPGRESKSCSQWLKFILITHHCVDLDVIKSPYHGWAEQKQRLCQNRISGIPVWAYR